jgi:hypothetical protein
LTFSSQVALKQAEVVCVEKNQPIASLIWTIKPSHDNAEKVDFASVFFAFLLGMHRRRER